MLSWLMEWYNNQCDGDWEHYYGVKIDTIDNPGWNIEIDTTESEKELEDLPWQWHEIAENDWYGYKVENSVFIGSSDPKKLEKLISIFKSLIEGSTDAEI